MHFIDINAILEFVYVLIDNVFFEDNYISLAFSSEIKIIDLFYL